MKKHKNLPRIPYTLSLNLDFDCKELNTFVRKRDFLPLETINLTPQSKRLRRFVKKLTAEPGGGITPRSFKP
ncbi:MAG: hypothetical protein V2I33_16945 [Kangiellaceae bacterium]|nr:hypothetical protein [Kangiellaceae bacterium]